MAKQILFLVTSHGEDGRGKECIEFASVNEQERNAWHNGHKNKNWNSKADRIIDINVQKSETLTLINPLQKLLLGISIPSQGVIPPEATGKQIMFLVTHIGNKGKEIVEFASLNEEDRDSFYNTDKLKEVKNKTDRIVNIDTEKTSVLKQLNALQKLALGIKQPECKKK